ncbi:MAG: alcohol dehydrogenase [Chloroflexi bacterium RBG_16_47_49]|nr:MAG: alcohol dehydrogenase [Chloroflexi bacterium RBG_16_47_49]
MRSLWLENQNLKFRVDVPVPVPERGEALIRVLLAGVCSTDLELVRGYYPFSGVPGHEFVGEVVNSPDDPTWIGKRVVGEINIACGQCEMCQEGLNRHCEHRKTLGIHAWNGSFSEYLVLPLTNLRAVPEHIPNEIAVFTEPLAAAHEILEQTTMQPADRVLIIGAGRLGQLVAAVIQFTGCQLDVVARHQKLRMLLEKQNIHVISESSLGSRKYDVVIEATGSVEGFVLACKSVRPRGRIVLKSTYQGNTEVNFSGIVVDEVTLIGSRCGSFEPALGLLAEGKVDPRPLIEATYPLDHGVSAFGYAARPAVLKVLIQPTLP